MRALFFCPRYLFFICLLFTSSTTQALSWYVTLHGSETAFDLDKSSYLFIKAKEIGFTGLRTDIAWKEIEPIQGQVNHERLDFYKDYIDSAYQHELEVMVIFSNAPDWAIYLYHNDKQSFWRAYENYVGTVINGHSKQVSDYQLWNEANHFIDPIESEDDPELFSRAGKLVKYYKPDSRTFVNVMANLPLWERSFDLWIAGSGEYIDVIALDHYPGTWSPVADDNWKLLERALVRVNDPEDSWYGKDLAVIETGFSSWLWPLASEARQAQWMDIAITKLQGMFKNQDQTYGLVAGGIYQLVDTCSDIFSLNSCYGDGLLYNIGVEAHFGLLHSDYSEKPAFWKLRNLLGTHAN